MTNSGTSIYARTPYSGFTYQQKEATKINCCNHFIPKESESSLDVRGPHSQIYRSAVIGVVLPLYVPIIVYDLWCTMPCFVHMACLIETAMVSFLVSIRELEALKFFKSNILTYLSKGALSEDFKEFEV